MAARRRSKRSRWSGQTQAFSQRTWSGSSEVDGRGVEAETGGDRRRLDGQTFVMPLATDAAGAPGSRRGQGRCPA